MSEKSTFYLVREEILPEAIKKTIKVKEILKRGEIKTINEAVEKMGLSRSAYYKYKDFILEPSEMDSGRKAVLSMLLTHETGVLSNLLGRISEQGGSVLTITQSLPIHRKASVTLSLDLSGVGGSLKDLVTAVEATPGVENVRLVAVE